MLLAVVRSQTIVVGEFMHVESCGGSESGELGHGARQLGARVWPSGLLLYRDFALKELAIVVDFAFFLQELCLLSFPFLLKFSLLFDVLNNASSSDDLGPLWLFFIEHSRTAYG